MKQIISHRAVGDPNNGFTTYGALCNGPLFNSDEKLGGYQPWAASGTLRNLIIRVGTAPGSGKSWTYTIRINGVDTSVTCVISDSATEARDVANSVSVTAGDYVSLKVVPSGSPASSGAVHPHICIEFEGSTGESVYGRSYRAIVSAGTSGFYFAPLSGYGWESTAASVSDVIPCDGSLTALYVIGSENFSATVTELALYVNGVKQDGSGGTQDTRVNFGNTGLGVLTDSATFNVPVVSGDTVYIGVTKANGEWPGIRFGVRFTATTDGHSIVASCGDVPSASTTEYGKLGFALSDFSTTESLVDSIGAVSPSSLGRLHVVCGTAPGSGKSVTIALRKNAATQTPTVTIADLDTDGADTTHGAAIVDGDEYAVISVPSGTPSVSVFRYSMVQTISSPIVGSAVFGVDTTVSVTRAIAFGLDGNTNLHTEEGKFKVYGRGEYTEDLKVITPVDPMDAVTKAYCDANGGLSALDDLTDVIITAPTLGQVLKYDGTDWINDTDATGGGGSGDSTTTAAQASRPAASNDGDLFFPNNGLSVQRDTGAAWALWGPIFPLTAPVDGDFSWVNQGSAAVVTTFGGIFLRAPAVTGTSIRLRVKTAPATPYVITAAVLPSMLAGAAAGLTFRQSSDGKLATFFLSSEALVARLYSAKYTNPTTFSANYTNSPTTFWNISGLVWLRIEDTGTNRICSLSADGQNWIVYHSIGRTDYLTADQVGFWVNAASTLYEAGMTLVSWKET